MNFTFRMQAGLAEDIDRLADLLGISKAQVLHLAVGLLVLATEVTTDGHRLCVARNEQEKPWPVPIPELDRLRRRLESGLVPRHEEARSLPEALTGAPTSSV